MTTTRRPFSIDPTATRNGVERARAASAKPTNLSPLRRNVPECAIASPERGKSANVRKCQEMSDCPRRWKNEPTADDQRATIESGRVNERPAPKTALTPAPKSIAQW
jgi:hypothetical protein